MKSACNRPVCGVCGQKLVKNGKTSSRRTRWRCLACGASTVKSRPDISAKAQADLFIKWLLEGYSIKQLGIGKTSFAIGAKVQRLDSDTSAPGDKLPIRIKTMNKDGETLVDRSSHFTAVDGTFDLFVKLVVTVRGHQIFFSSLLINSMFVFRRRQ